MGACMCTQMYVQYVSVHVCICFYAVYIMLKFYSVQYRDALLFMSTPLLLELHNFFFGGGANKTD